MSKIKELNKLKKELMHKYKYMQTPNNTEFKQRLQWLSEGMLKVHMSGGHDYKVNKEEIDLYNEYTEEKKRIETDGGVKPKLLETNKTIEADLRKLGTSIKRKDIVMATKT